MAVSKVTKAMTTLSCPSHALPETIALPLRLPGTYAAKIDKIRPSLVDDYQKAC